MVFMDVADVGLLFINFRHLEVFYLQGVLVVSMNFVMVQRMTYSRAPMRREQIGLFIACELDFHKGLTNRCQAL